MVSRKYVPNKGFGWALVYTVITFVLLFYGLKTGLAILLLLSMLTGFVGLYYVKKSWKPLVPKKKKKVASKKVTKRSKK